ncbi:MAG: hypothetical protein FJW39_35245 [Acidobacteria bacterium]|nr:hypothetical protein [Acidobacteriota bacterium]
MIVIRMLEPVPYFLRAFGTRPDQYVIYVGDRPMNMEDGYSDGHGMTYRFILIDIRSLITKEEMLNSPLYGDFLLAILCVGGNNRETLMLVLGRIMELPVEQRKDAIGKLIVLAGLRKLDTVFFEEIEKMPLLIDPQENVILKSIYGQGMEKGLVDGKAAGIAEGDHNARVSTLRAVLTKRFGPLPAWVEPSVETATAGQLEAWTTHAIDAPTIESVFE